MSALSDQPRSNPVVLLGLFTDAVLHDLRAGHLPGQLVCLSIWRAARSYGHGTLSRIPTGDCRRDPVDLNALPNPDEYEALNAAMATTHADIMPDASAQEFAEHFCALLQPLTESSPAPIGTVNATRLITILSALSGHLRTATSARPSA